MVYNIKRNFIATKRDLLLGIKNGVILAAAKERDTCVDVLLFLVGCQNISKDLFLGGQLNHFLKVELHIKGTYALDLDQRGAVDVFKVFPVVKLNLTLKVQLCTVRGLCKVIPLAEILFKVRVHSTQTATVVECRACKVRIHTDSEDTGILEYRVLDGYKGVDILFIVCLLLLVGEGVVFLLAVVFALGVAGQVGRNVIVNTVNKAVGADSHNELTGTGENRVGDVEVDLFGTVLNIAECAQNSTSVGNSGVCNVNVVAKHFNGGTDVVKVNKVLVAILVAFEVTAAKLDVADGNAFIQSKADVILCLNTDGCAVILAHHNKVERALKECIGIQGSLNDAVFFGLGDLIGNVVRVDDVAVAVEVVSELKQDLDLCLACFGVVSVIGLIVGGVDLGVDDLAVDVTKVILDIVVENDLVFGCLGCSVKVNVAVNVDAVRYAANGVSRGFLFNAAIIEGCPELNLAYERIVCKGDNTVLVDCHLGGGRMPSNVFNKACTCLGGCFEVEGEGLFAKSGCHQIAGGSVFITANGKDLFNAVFFCSLGNRHISGTNNNSDLCCFNLIGICNVCCGQGDFGDTRLLSGDNNVAVVVYGCGNIIVGRCYLIGNLSIHGS